MIFDPAGPDLANPGCVESAALDLLPTGIGIFGNKLTLVYSNRSFRELRMLPERLCAPGTRLEDIVSYIAARGDYGVGEVEALVEDRMAEILKLEPWKAEQDIEGRRQLAIRHTPVPGLGLMITYADVTEERATERKLRENEERYSHVTEAASEGIYDWNINDNTLYVSERVMELFGFDGYLTSQDWFSRVHPDDAEDYREELRECFRGKSGKVACEYRIRVRDGDFRWVEDRGLPIRDPGGRTIRLVGCISDVTKKRSMEDALRDSEQRHSTAMQAMNEGVYEWDIATGEMYYSPRLYHLIALTPKELATRQDWLDRIHPDDMPHYVTATVAHLKGATERLEVEYRFRHADGTWHWASQHGVASRDPTGRAYRVSGSTGDITELKAAQQQLIVQGKMASLGQLTAGIAHEIKNPLNFVNNFSALSVQLVDELKEALVPVALDHTKQQEVNEITDLLKGNLEKITEHGKRADLIVKTMLLHSREGSREHRLSDINAIVDEAVNLAYHSACTERQGFKITLERSFDPAAGQVDLFPQEITRVLLNLISNGFYAATKRRGETAVGDYEPTLTAATKSLGDSVEIRIRDNGQGIAPEVRDKIFNPFFTTKPPGEGTGLGLSLSYDIIVKQHAGSIEVDTQPGEFTEFRVLLPRMAAGGKARARA